MLKTDIKGKVLSRFLAVAITLSVSLVPTTAISFTSTAMADGGGGSDNRDSSDWSKSGKSTSKRKVCKSQAYAKIDAEAFCKKKLGKKNVKCGGKPRRWICR